MIALLKSVWEKDYGDPSRKLVMLCLADMANNAGVCWPSVQTIANRCGMHKRSVHRHLKALAAMGAITITHQFKGGEKDVNRYKIEHGGSDVDVMGVVTPASHRTTIEPGNGLADPRSLITRPTQLPLSKRRSRIEPEEPKR